VSTGTSPAEELPVVRLRVGAIPPLTTRTKYVPTGRLVKRTSRRSGRCRWWWRRS
jgi:hypothetical protein